MKRVPRRTPPLTAIALRSIQELAQALESFASNPGDAAFGPAKGCPALQERLALPSELDPMNAYYQAGYLHEFTVDNVVAFTKLFHAPVPAMAPFVCVRAALESASIAAWLADPSITPRGRVARSLAFRKEGLVQQKKLAGTDVQVDKSRIERRMQQIEDLITQLRSLADTEERLTSVMPSTTELVRDCLNKEADYRILSAVAHAHLWALQQVSFRIERDEEGPRLEKKIEPAVIIYLCTLAATSLATPLRILARQYGWKAPIIQVTIDRISRVASEPARLKPATGPLPA